MKSPNQIRRIKIYYKKLFILANRLFGQAKGELTRKEAFAYAKDFLKHHNDECYILTAVSTKGVKSTRVVFTNWIAYNKIKGTGKPTPSNVKLFVDVAKRELGKPSTVSFREENILQIAA